MCCVRAHSSPAMLHLILAAEPISFETSHLHIRSIVDLVNETLRHFIISHKHHDCTYCVCVPWNIGQPQIMCTRSRVVAFNHIIEKYIYSNKQFSFLSLSLSVFLLVLL